MRPDLIRALYLQPAAQFGGAERQAATIIPLLREHGVDVLPYIGPGTAISDWMEERGVHEYVFSRSLPGAASTPGGLARVERARHYAHAWAACRREIEGLIRAYDIDVIFAALAFSWVVATPIARRLRVPIVWRAGGTECTPGQRWWLAAWARWQPPDMLVCNGDAVREFYEPLIGAPTVTIRNGVDAAQFHPGAGVRDRLRTPHARHVIGFAGRLVPQKRPEDFIALAARFAHRPDVAFLLAGDGSRRAHYAELARATGAHTLEVLGYVADMRDLYAACDVLVLPSRSEGCPNVILEAMAMRTAVVAADTPATREIVRSGADGILYPVGDLDALTAIIERLIAEPASRRLIVERGYRRVRQELTAEACAAETARLLRGVACAHPASRARAIAALQTP